MATDPFTELKFRDPARARALSRAIHETVRRIGRASIPVMHVCGSHEQAIARFGLRAVLPPELEVIMGPGCPVCVTDAPEVDAAVALADQGKRVCTYGDMLRLPGVSRSLADAQAEGARVDVVYGVAQAARLARAHPDEDVVFFASGFETTAVATAAELLAGTPANFYVLSAHKYVPAAMEVVAASPGNRIEGYIAAGHAATITGSDVFVPFARRTGAPVVVAGFEPLDILAAVLRLVELIEHRRPEVENLYPRCVTGAGNGPALETLWKVFEPTGGVWRGISAVEGGNLRLKADWAHLDAAKVFDVRPEAARADGDTDLSAGCLCGDIMMGLASPTDCRMFRRECTPEAPVGACMVSSEGTCRIWHQYGGLPDLRGLVA